MKKENHNSTFSIDKLKSIREEKNISIESLSDILKVSKAFIDYIENGQFEKLGAPTFIRGHVSNYSKALSLDPSVVLQQIPAHILQTQTIKPSDAYGASPLARVKHNSNHLGKYAIGTALLTMLALSFYFVWDKWSVPKSSDEDLTNFTATNNQSDRDATNKNKNITYSSLIPQVSLDSSANNNSTNSAADITSDETSDNTDEFNEVDSRENQAELEDNDTEAMGDDVVSPQVLEGNDDLNTVTEMAAYSIELQLEEQAWVSINTKDGDRVVQDLIGPGVVQYQVNKPLHFRIGNANQARVIIDGESVDISAYLKNGIADFDWPIDPS